MYGKVHVLRYIIPELNVYVWNNLPSNVVESTSIWQFRSLLKSLDLNVYCRGRAHMAWFTSPVRPWNSYVYVLIVKNNFCMCLYEFLNKVYLFIIIYKQSKDSKLFVKHQLPVQNKRRSREVHNEQEKHTRGRSVDPLSMPQREKSRERRRSISRNRRER